MEKCDACICISVKDSNHLQEFNFFFLEEIHFYANQIKKMKTLYINIRDFFPL